MGQVALSRDIATSFNHLGGIAKLLVGVALIHLKLGSLSAFKNRHGSGVLYTSIPAPFTLGLDF